MQVWRLFTFHNWNTERTPSKRHRLWLWTFRKYVRWLGVAAAAKVTGNGPKLADATLEMRSLRVRFRGFEKTCNLIAAAAAAHRNFVRFLSALRFRASEGVSEKPLVDRNVAAAVTGEEKNLRDADGHGRVPGGSRGSFSKRRDIIKYTGPPLSRD